MNSRYIKRIVASTAFIALCVVSATIFLTGTRTKFPAESATAQGAAALEQLKQNDQYESLQAAMKQARFGVSRLEQSPLGRSAWHAPNPTAGYDAYVTESSVSIAPKETDKDSSVVSLRLNKLGYGDDLRAVAPGKVSGDKQTITIEREGMSEWFVNGVEGLEHGFTLDERPQSAIRNSQNPLRLALQVSEGWRANASEDSQQVTLRNGSGQAIEYGKLAVSDARGVNVAAKMTVANSQVLIEVADHDAEYPLTIDPLFTLQKQLLANDGADFDLFGYAVALDGNTAIIGAPYDEVTHTDQGSVYVFVRSGTNWTLQQKLFAGDGQPGDKFGSAVALSGDTALSGAPESDEGANTEIGSAYVFVRSGTTWSFQQKLGASGGMAGALFGAAVALDGNTALVGAHEQTISPSFATTGAAYVFVRNGAHPNVTWTQQQRLLSNDAVDGDRFGFSVALDGDTALIGAPNVTITASGQGAAYIFTRSGTVWTQQPRLNLDSAQARGGDQFGNAVALSGEFAAIGIHLRGSNDSGAVALARRGATGAWTLVQLFGAPNPVAGAHFGESLAMDGGLMIVGASLGLNAAGVDQRTAYVFAVNNMTFVGQLGVEVGNADDRFGYAVAVKGDTVLVGAYRADAASTDQGAAYTFTLHDSQHIQQPKLIANDGAADDEFGEAVAISGDVLVVGVEDAKIGTNTDQGAVYVYIRNGAGWAFQGKITAPDGAARDGFGHAVALSGNTLAVGAVSADIGGNADQGAAYVFIRNGATWAMQKKLFAVGIDGSPGDLFGVKIALEGDTLVVGAVGQDSLRGAAYVFTRTGTAWAQQGPKLLAPDGTFGDRFGTAVAISGNTLMVGAPHAKIGTNAHQGAAYVFARANAAWAFQRKLTASDGAAEDWFGISVAVYGDTAVIGASKNTLSAQGAVYPFTRSGASWVQEPKLTADDGTATNKFGYAVALSGDTLVAGAYGRNSLQGAAYVFTRLGSWRQQQQLIANDGQPSDDFGLAVALSGDTIVVGARGDTIGTNELQGSVYTFTAPTCFALTLNPDSLPNGTVGVVYNQPFSISGGRAGEGFVYSLSGGALPPGLVYDDGLIGTPTTPGTYRFTITARSFLSQCPAVRSYTLTILPPCTLTINPPTLPNGTTGMAYQQPLSVIGATEPYSFTVSAGALPAGLTLHNLGAIVGTPTQAGTFNFTIRATDANDCQGTRAYSVTINGGGGATGLQFYPLAHPVRLLDTRPGASGCDAPGAMIIGGTSRTQTAAGRTCDGLTIPANAKALTGNVTTVESGGGYLTLYPSDAAQPFVANSNFTPNQILNNVFTVGLGANDGAFKIFVVTNTNVVVDVTGYYAPPAVGGLYFHPLPKPIRLLETRVGEAGCFTPGTPLQGGANTTQLGITSCGGVTIPAGVQALVGNATTVGPQNGGYLTLYPADAAQPFVASSNFLTGDIMNAPFTVGLSPSGQFKIFTTVTTDLVIDVSGYYSTQLNDVNGQGLLFNSLAAPIRLLDTRAGETGCFTPGAPMAGGVVYTQSAVGACVNIPATAKAAVGNATTVNVTAGGYLTFWPSNAAQPLVATSNFLAGQIFNRHFIVGLGADGAFKRYSSAGTDLVIDMSGYFAP